MNLQSLYLSYIFVRIICFLLPKWQRKNPTLNIPSSQLSRHNGYLLLSTSIYLQKGFKSRFYSNKGRTQSEDCGVKRFEDYKKELTTTRQWKDSYDLIPGIILRFYFNKKTRLWNLKHLSVLHNISIVMNLLIMLIIHP